MAQSYRLEVAAPSTTVANAKTWAFSPDTGNVVSVDLELKKEKHRISVLQATIYDPRFEIFSALPDPALFTVPVTLYLATPEQPSIPSQKVFVGHITSLQLGYPAYDRMTIVAHDESIEARRNKRYQTVKNVRGDALAKQIAAAYGLTVDIQGAPTFTNRVVEIGAQVSDWDLLARVLYYDGLEIYTDGSTWRIRQIASQNYRTTFQKDEPPVVKLEASINHIGSGYDKKGSVALENSGTYVAAQSSQAEAKKENASERSHRRPVGGSVTTNTGSHSESPGNKGWTNVATQLRRRKDTAVIEMLATPDIGIQHIVNLSGWGGKVDGPWHINVIKHVITGSEFAATTLEMQRAASSGSSAASGVPFSQ